MGHGALGQTPNPQSPIPNPHFIYKKLDLVIDSNLNLSNIKYFFE
jgi:hypothetical protein